MATTTTAFPRPPRYCAAFADPAHAISPPPIPPDGQASAFGVDVIASAPVDCGIDSPDPFFPTPHLHAQPDGTRLTLAAIHRIELARRITLCYRSILYSTLKLVHAAQHAPSQIMQHAEHVKKLLISLHRVLNACRRWQAELHLKQLSNNLAAFYHQKHKDINQLLSEKPFSSMQVDSDINDVPGVVLPQHPSQLPTSNRHYFHSLRNKLELM